MLCFLDGVTDSYGVNATLMLSQCRRWQAAGAMTPNLTTDRLLSYVLWKHFENQSAFSEVTDKRISKRFLDSQYMVVHAQAI